MRPSACCWAIPLALLLTVAGDAVAGQRVGLLSVHGAGEPARRLERELAAALGSGGREVIDPPGMKARLGRDAKTRPTLDRAREALKRAEREGIYMNRAAALEAARRALELLRAADARHHDPRLVAWTHVAEALALLLKPADEAGALAAMRVAVAADPGYRPDQDRLPSRAAGLLERARATRPAPRPPTAAQLARLAAGAGVDAVVWVAVTPGSGGEHQLDLRVYDHAARRLKAERRGSAPAARLSEVVTGWTAAALAPPSPSIPAATSRATTSAAAPQVPPAAAATQREVEPAHRKEPPARPWYKRWWIWTLAGAVLVGTGVAVGVAAGSRTERSYEFRFSY